MKPKSTLRNFLAIAIAIAGSSLLAAPSVHAATYTWDNSNVTGLTPPSSLNWLNATQGSWTGGTPVSSNLNTIQFFQDFTTALPNTGATGNTQASIIDNGGSAFQLGALTLSGLASATSGANLTMNISGDALNFSALTGTINLNALNATRTITYNLDSNIQLGTASSAGALTLTGNGTSAFNIGGIISELQTGGGSLIKSGTSTVTLTGANTYTGATNINAGTLTLGGASGALASTAINLNGGGLTLSNTTNSGVRISDTAIINVNGNSALTFSHAGAAATDYAETIDTLSLQSGFLTFTGSQAHATGPRTSNVQFNTLSRSGTATVNFAGTGLGLNARNTIKFGAGVTDGVDLGPWAVVNGADFASYSTGNGIVVAANTTLLAGSSGNTTNWKLTGGNIAITGGTNPFYKTLLISDTTARTLTTTGNTVSVGGISSIGQNHVISGTGALQALTAGDALYINVGSAATNNALTISSVIQNVGAGVTASAVVKSGVGKLTLSNTNTFTGGFVSNGGIVDMGTANVDSLGASGSSVTINGTTTLATNGTTTFNKSFVLNNGSMLNMSGNGPTTISGAVTGTGGIGSVGAGSVEQRTVNLTSTANTFTGPIILNWDNQNFSAIAVNSLSDAAGSGTINLFANASGAFIWGASSGAPIAPLVLNNRQFQISSTTAAANLTIKSAASAGNFGMTINTDLLVTSAGTKTLTLTNLSTAINTFAGKIVDGPGAVVSVTSNAGIWALTGANTYTGATTVSAGTLQVSTLADGLASSSIGTSTNVAGNLILNGGTLRYTGTAVSTDRLFSLQTNGGIDSSGTGAVNFTNTGAMGFNTGVAAKTLTLTGTNTGDNTIAASIANNTAATSLTKTGAGKWVLTNTNTYTGNTDVNGGTLELKSAASTITQTLGALRNQGGEGTLVSNKSGTGDITTTFNGTYARAAGATGNIVSTGGSNGGTNTVNMNGALGFIDKGLYFGGSEFAARHALNGYVRALAYGSDTNAAAVNTITAASHVKLDTTPGSQAAVSLLSLNLSGGGVSWTTTSGALNVPGIIKSGGGAGSTISGGTLTTTSNAELVIRTDVASDSLNVTSQVTGFSGGLTKSGAGTLTLSHATNGYTGNTRVNAGTLIVNGSISSSSLTTVASAATIGGSGTVGALTVSSGGFISGGDSVDSTSVLNINGAYSQAGLYTAHIDGITTGVFDQLNVTGAVNIAGGSLTAMFTGSYAVNDMIFILLNDGADAINGTYSGLAQGATFSSGGYDWSISYEANNTGIGTGTFTGGNDIVLMAIPEPHTALLGCLGVLLLLRRRR